MIRALYFLLALCGAALSGCAEQGPETLEQCIARFSEGPGEPAFASSRRLATVYTYTFPDGTDAAFVDEVISKNPRGSIITMQSGGSGEPPESFFAEPATPEGALFVSENTVLYRVAGEDATRNGAIRTGCAETPAGARLLRMEWIAKTSENET